MPIQTGMAKPGLGLFGSMYQAMQDRVLPRMALMGQRALPMVVQAGRQGVDFARSYPGRVADRAEGAFTTARTLGGMAESAARRGYGDLVNFGDPDYDPETRDIGLDDAARKMDMTMGRPQRLRAMSMRDEPMMQRLTEADRRLRDRGMVEYIWDNYLQKQGVEGGNNPVELKDGAGLTNYGISQNNNRDLNVSSITEDEAFTRAYENYWKPYGLEAIAREDPVKAAVLFDAIYNHGPGATMKEILPQSDGTVPSILRVMRARREANPTYGKHGTEGTGLVTRQRMLEDFVRQESLLPEDRRMGGRRSYATMGGSK